MRILGLDVGEKTIGVACSDALLMTAQAVGTIKRQSKKKDFAQLAAVCREREVHCIVVGKPSHMNGDRSENMEKIERIEPSKAAESVRQVAARKYLNPKEMEIPFDFD